MAAAPVPPIPVPEDAPLSEGARIVNTFLAPKRTFLDLHRNASWWGPFLVLSIASLGFSYTIDQKIGFRKVAENQIQLSPKAAQRIERLSPDQQRQAVDRSAVWIKNFLYGNPAVILLFNLIIAAVLFATFRFAAGADLKFKASYAIVMYAGLPLVVRTVLAIVSLAAGANPDTFVLQNPVATNPGYFLSPADSPFLFRLASAADIFNDLDARSHRHRLCRGCDLEAFDSPGSCLRLVSCLRLDKRWISGLVFLRRRIQISETRPSSLGR